MMPVGYVRNMEGSNYAHFVKEWANLIKEMCTDIMIFAFALFSNFSLLFYLFSTVVQ